jgi:hypothetical protein
MYIHFQQTDNDAHDYGAKSLQYKNSALTIDRQIGRIAVSMDFDNSVLIITSDHGHMDRGGHGGTEKEAIVVPLILVGKSIKPYHKHIEFDYKSPVIAEQTDISVTVSALLGIPPPLSSQGRILFEVLQMNDKDIAEKQFELAGTQYRFYSEYLLNLANYRPKESSLEKGESAIDENEYRTAFIKSLQAMDELRKDFENVREKVIKKERLTRSIIFIILLALPFAFILSSRFLIPSLIGISAGIVYISVFNTIFYISGNTYSFSTIVSAQSFIIQILVFSFISSMFSYATIIYLSIDGLKFNFQPSKSQTSRRDLKLEIVVSSILSLLPLYLIAVIGYLVVGIKVSHFIPDAKWSFCMFASELALCINGISLGIFIIAHYICRRYIFGQGKIIKVG